ncbi:MAG: riboflavin synthase [Planctomycetes bacterium]|nr:riboflavin synthase [Planctomycetota bacterium]
MFTGIIEGALPLASVADEGGVRRLTLDLSSLSDAGTLKLGDSVALNGCCLTVAKLASGKATFEAIPETLRLTNLGVLQTGDLVNVERAMQAGARFDGHFVQGHVDARGNVNAIDDRGGEWRVRIDCGREFAAHCIHKGSVCIDGISLTIAELHADALVVAIIPHTRQVTNIRNWKVGSVVNLEADMIGKYVRKQLEGQQGVSDELLRKAGFES